MFQIGYEQGAPSLTKHDLEKVYNGSFSEQIMEFVLVLLEGLLFGSLKQHYTNDMEIVPPSFTKGMLPCKDTNHTFYDAMFTHL